MSRQFWNVLWISGNILWVVNCEKYYWIFIMSIRQLLSIIPQLQCAGNNILDNMQATMGKVGCRRLWRWPQVLAFALLLNSRWWWGWSWSWWWLLASWLSWWCQECCWWIFFAGSTARFRRRPCFQQNITSTEKPSQRKASLVTLQWKCCLSFIPILAEWWYVSVRAAPSVAF